MQVKREQAARGSIRNLVINLIRVPNTLVVDILVILNFRRRYIMKKRDIVIVLLIFALSLSCAGVYASDLEGTINSYSSNVIEVNGITLESGEYKQYDKIHLKKGDSITADLQWDNNDGNVYLAVGTSFGEFNGLQSSGNGCLLSEITINMEGDYYIFIGVQHTHKTKAQNIHGQIIINSDSKASLDLRKNASAYETIPINQISLSPGSHETYGPFLLKKGNIVSIDVNWSEPGNLYFAIGTEFGNFNGLKSSGRDKTSFNDTLQVNRDGNYYIFVGVQNTESNSVDGISGEILYPSN